MQQLIQEVSERTQDTWANSLGECCGVAFQGSSFNDYKDAIPCEAPAVVALIEGEYEGLVLCGKCYNKLKKRGEL